MKRSALFPARHGRSISLFFPERGWARIGRRLRDDRRCCGSEVMCRRGIDRVDLCDLAATAVAPVPGA
jgi:hypothetical protein